MIASRAHLVLLAAAFFVREAHAAGPAEPVLVLRGHTSGVFNVSYSPNGKWLATASKDKTVRIWEADTAECKEVALCKGHGNDVYRVLFSPDSKLLASASDDQSVRLWSVPSGELVRTLTGHTGDVYNLAFSPDGKMLASSSYDQTVRLWEVQTGKELHVLKGHSARVLGVAFTSDGSRVVSSSPSSGGTGEHSEIRVWDAASGQEMYVMPEVVKGVVSIALSPDGKRVAGACQNGTVRIWELANGLESMVLRGHTRKPEEKQVEAYHVAFSLDGKRLATCSGNWNTEAAGEVKVWDLASGKELASLGGYPAPIWSVSFRADGRRLATATGKWNKTEPGLARIWDLSGIPDPAAPAVPTAQELEAIWNDLAGTDPVKAYRAVWALGGAGKGALPFLRERAKPPSGARHERIAKLIAELDHDDYDVRERAQAELNKMGSEPLPALRKALATAPVEVRRRIVAILEGKANGPTLSHEEVQAFRVIEVLERIGGAEVRPLLEKMGSGPPGSPVSLEAAGARERIRPK
jgi:WD40 repeat protein